MPRPAKRPMVSVIIPHFNDQRGLEICLRALRRQEYPQELFEIIVADNGSACGIAEVERVAGDKVRVVSVPEPGAGPARNGGAAVAQGEILAFIDSDCVAEPGWIAAGVAALADYDFVGGRVRVLTADPVRLTWTEAFERVFAFDFKNYIEKKGFSGAGNLLCPRALFNEVGGFKAGVSEDVEWSRRATAMGFRLGYAPLAVVGHPARRTWSELKAKWRRVNRETYALAGHGRARLALLARTFLLPASCVAHTPKVLWSPELETVEQKLAALAMLIRIRFWRMADMLGLFANGGRT